MQIRNRVWIDLLMLLALVGVAGGGVAWYARITSQSREREAAALQVVNLALELNAFAYEQQQLGVNWPRNQWVRKLGELEATLNAPALQRLGNQELLRNLDQDALNLRHLVEGVAPAWGSGQANTLYKLTGALVRDSMHLVDAAHQQMRQRERLLNILLVGGVSVLGLAWALGSLLVSRTVRRSLMQLSAAAGAVARGETECRLEERGLGEVRALARAFNIMCDHLRQAHQALSVQLEERGREAALREAALAEVHAERTLLLEIMNLAPTGLAIFEGDEPRLKWSNAAFRHFLDEAHRGVETPGRGLEEIIPWIDERQWHEIIEDLRRSRQPYISTVDFDSAGHPNGEVFWQWRLYPLEQDGVPPDLLLALVNVTAQTRDRQRLEELAARLEQMNQAKDNFMALLGHELRNPLAPIRNSLYVLKQRGFEHDAQRHSLAIIERQVHHMTRLVDDLLDVSRISRGKIELRRTRVGLEQIVHQAVESAGALIQSRGHALEVQLPQEPVLLDADPARLEQILVNLLNNAAKYTEPGGRIWLTAEREGGGVAIRVRDTGVGIAPEMLPDLFEPFSQVDRSLDLSQGGLGLGLALVRSLARLHGGDVEVHSEGVGRGSEFIVRLPALPEGARLARRPAGAGSAGGRGLRILIAEDNPDTSSSMAELLAMWGHESAVAGDGPSALAMALEYQPDVVLLDIGLPGMDGYQVARKLREIPGLSSVPIIAVSGFGQSEDVDRSRQEGIQHHLTKPIDLERLHELLASCARGESLEALG